ncbi:putative transport protein [Brevibacillus brevis NBRC 100599]|uniref:Putative transport protein n=1 Tax=Brevibacillus brevis (strain 47 / JCM 6285 / NBRC 100599) TaxID=358681 RepID=C0ZJP8_BREBN|nr:tripartite tricarboxylate transporter TctB family protein [Brevibacillus brevis]BAH45623.1 putative transport protein [Brevibacillus brevis NBRC 100599]
MRRPDNQPDFIGALLSMILGVVLSFEAYRLEAFSTSLYVGDHTLPAILGFLFFMLGGVLLVQSFRVTEEASSPNPGPLFPGKRLRLLLCFLFLLLYVWLLGAIGYTMATLFVSFAFFILIGSYRWRTSIVYSVLLTGGLYVVFIYSLHITLPGGDWF